MLLKHVYSKVLVLVTIIAFTTKQVSSHSSCIGPISSSHSKDSKDKTPFQCSNILPCCAGFSCNRGSCIPDFAPPQVSSPAEYALVSHVALEQLHHMSNVVHSTVERAARAVSVANQQLNMMSYGNADNDRSDNEDDFNGRISKRFNDTMQAIGKEFNDFCETTKAQFTNNLHDPKSHDNNSSTPSYVDWSQYIPKNISNDNAHKSSENSSSFNWQQFVPRGIDIDKQKEMNDKNSKKHHTVSNFESTGFDWTVYVPPGTGQGSNSTSQFNWSQFVPQPGKGGPSKESKPEQSASSEQGRSLRKKKKDSDDSSNTQSGGYDYSQYIPKGMNSYHSSDYPGLFQNHLEANDAILLTYYDQDPENPHQPDVEELKKFLLANTKNVSAKAQLVAEQAAQFADNLADSLKTAAANLKQAAKELQEKTEQRYDESVSHAASKDEKEPEGGYSIGEYFVIALLIAFVGFMGIVFCNGRRNGYSNL